MEDLPTNIMEVLKTSLLPNAEVHFKSYPMDFLSGKLIVVTLENKSSDDYIINTKKTEL